MTREEAIKILSKDTSEEKVNELIYYAGFSQTKVVEMIQEAMEMGAKALEKQIPKKPINKELKKYSGGTQVLFADCPMCEQPVKIYNGHQNNKEFRRDEDVYCNHCGQALDWS